MRTTRFVLTAGRVSRQLFGRPVGGAGGRLAQRTAHDGAEPTASSAAAASPLPPWRARATRTPADLGRASHGADGVGAAGRARGGGGYEHDEHGSTRVLRVYSRDEVRALLDRALHRSSRQTVYWFGGTTLFLLLAWLLYREQAKAKMTQELADLASRSLGNKSVQSKTAEMSMATLAALLADDQTRVRTLDWLQHMLEDPRMIAAVVHLVQQVRAARPGSLRCVCAPLCLFRSVSHICSSAVARRDTPPSVPAFLPPSVLSRSPSLRTAPPVRAAACAPPSAAPRRSCRTRTRSRRPPSSCSSSLRSRPCARRSSPACRT
jgi:hypothetical protein